ncbi:SDR family oxidoreductase [Nonomuraea sp. NPDC050536]|uniref:SDR family oxidoreductase n=1 Tax=Nonomuraea sp. NPDC050536 TaxID=3364366 RepID=UPI0037CC725A
MRFRDQVVAVTGAAGGIGRVLVDRFTAEGAVVAEGDIQGASGVDVTDRATVQEWVAGVERRHGPIDVLVNNAAVARDAEFVDLPEEQWHHELDVSLTGAFLCAQAVLPGMLERRRGVIVNISSVNAVSYFGNEAYSAAKAGLLSLTRSLAVKYGPHGVRCNAVVPGTIRTPIWDERVAVAPDILDRLAVWYPLGRVGTPDDVASAVLFLASADAAWITGVALPVDGGLLAGNRLMTEQLVIT